MYYSLLIIKQYFLYTLVHFDISLVQNKLTDYLRHHNSSVKQKKKQYFFFHNCATYGSQQRIISLTNANCRVIYQKQNHNVIRFERFNLFSGMDRIASVIMFYL
jgi:hypothetical protein